MTAKTVEMNLTPGEAKLIYRLRQLQNQNETRICMVSTKPLALSVMTSFELLENNFSGSGIFG